MIKIAHSCGARLDIGASVIRGEACANAEELHSNPGCISHEGPQLVGLLCSRVLETVARLVGSRVARIYSVYRQEKAHV